MRYNDRHPVKAWLPLAVTITLAAFLVYNAAQIIVRANADTPQVQLAEDASVALMTGATPIGVVSQFPVVSIGKTLAVFIAVYDKTGKIVASSGKIGNLTPTVPLGILEKAKLEGEYRATWEPSRGIRQAIIARYYSSGQNSGFVVVGKSLREADQIKSSLFKAVVWGWLISLFVTFTTIIFVRRASRIREEAQ